MSQQPYWCPKPVVWELTLLLCYNSILFSRKSSIDAGHMCMYKMLKKNAIEMTSWGFLGALYMYLPSWSFQNYVTLNKDLEKWPPQLY